MRKKTMSKFEYHSLLIAIRIFLVKQVFTSIKNICDFFIKQEKKAKLSKKAAIKTVKTGFIKTFFEAAQGKQCSFPAKFLLSCFYSFNSLLTDEKKLVPIFVFSTSFYQQFL